MKNKRKRFLIISLAFLLALLIPLGAWAVKSGLPAKSSGGGYYSKTVNRMDFSVTNTDFVLEKTKEGAESFLLETQIDIRKCEADFYAKIKSIEITGQKINRAVFYSTEEKGENYFPEDIIIRDDKTHTWNCEISFEGIYPVETQAQLIIEYESGISLDTADAHRLTVPISITVANKQ